MTLQSNYTSYETPRFRKLSDDQTERLHHASLEILDRTGVCLYEPEALDAAAEEGPQGRRGQPRAHPTGAGGVGAEHRAEARGDLRPQRPPRHAAGAQQRVLRPRLRLPECH